MRISDWSSDVCSSDLCSPLASIPVVVVLEIVDAALQLVDAGGGRSHRTRGGNAELAHLAAEVADVPADRLGDGHLHAAPGGAGRLDGQIARASVRERVGQ